MTKLNLKEAIGRISLKTNCHDDFDYSSNMNKSLIALSLFALNQCSFPFIYFTSLSYLKRVH